MTKQTKKGKTQSSFNLIIGITVLILAVSLIIDAVLNATGPWDELLQALAIVLILVLWFYFRSALFNPLKALYDAGLKRLKENRLSSKEVEQVGLIEAVHRTIGKLSDSIERSAGFIQNIEQGKFEEGQQEEATEEETDSAEQDKLTEALVNMRTQMREFDKEERERKWISEGINLFADLFRKHNSDEDGTLAQLSDDVISNLVKYLEANQGALFVLNDDDTNNKFLEMNAVYAYNRKKYEQRTVQIGQGLVGQCYLERQRIYMTKVPASYVNITSGLGESTPRCIIIQPLEVNETIMGIVEIASFKPLEDYQFEFLDRVSENIASAIGNIKINERTRRLLAESMQQAEEMRAQEEEMRQNMEELAATQEEMARKQNELARSEAMSKAFFEGSMDGIIGFDDAGNVNTINSATEKMFGFKRTALEEGTLNVKDMIMGVMDGDFMNGQRRRLKGKKRGGDKFDVEVFVNQAANQADGTSNLIAYVRNITVEIQKELAITQNMKEIAKAKNELERVRKEEAERAAMKIESQNQLMKKSFEKMKAQLADRDKEIAALKEKK